MSALSSGLSVAVLGSGRWARALTALLEKHREQTPERIARVLSINDEAALHTLEAADLLILATPAAMVRPLMQQAARFLHGAQLLIHAIGSLAPVAADGSRALISEVVRLETPLRRIGALAGPALALDLEQRRPAALVCGSRFDEVSALAKQVLSGPSLLIYTTRDQLGVEVARATAAVVALAGGIADAIGLGAAARAVLVTRGAAEMARLGVALGASEQTFFGLAGVGEMMLATDGHGSADFELGRLLGQGLDLPTAQYQVARVCDGPGMIKEILRLGAVHKLHLPLSTTLSTLLAGQSTAQRALGELFFTESRRE